MSQSASGRHKVDFLSNSDLTAEQTRAVFRRALELKAGPPRFDPHHRSVALLFQKTSTRTRCSFESGLVELGFHPIFIDWRTSNFTLSDLRDESRVLSEYACMIMARLERHTDLEQMAEASVVPVINGMTDRFHPCQALADFLTIYERFGSFDGVEIGYVGDGANVCQSLIQTSALLGVPIRVAHPSGYGPREDVVSLPGVADVLTLTDSPQQAVTGVLAVYTDAWIGIGLDDERSERIAAFGPYQVTADLFALAEPGAIFLHCLPAHRGEEVTDEVIDHERSLVIQQALNRKYAQMALIEHLADASPRT